MMASTIASVPIHNRHGGRVSRRASNLLFERASHSRALSCVVSKALNMMTLCSHSSRSGASKTSWMRAKTLKLHTRCKFFARVVPLSRLPVMILVSGCAFSWPSSIMLSVRDLVSAGVSLRSVNSVEGLKKIPADGLAPDSGPLPAG